MSVPRPLCATLLFGLLLCGYREAPAEPPPLRMAFDLWPGFYPAYLAGEFAELLVRRMLDSAGLALADVDPVNVNAADVPRELAAGRMAALAHVARAVGQSDSSLSIVGVRFPDLEENRRRFAGAPGAKSLSTTIEDDELFFGELGRPRSRVDATRVINAEFLR